MVDVINIEFPLFIHVIYRFYVAQKTYENTKYTLKGQTFGNIQDFKKKK